MARLDFTTGATPEPPYETTIAATSGLGEYFKSIYDDKTGNYQIKITNIVYDDYGYADSAGHAFTLDLYAPKAENAMQARIPTGTYHFDADDTGAQFSVGRGYSKIEQTDEQGYPKGAAMQITAAEVRVKTVDEGYDIAAYVTDKEGHTYKVTYRGDMVLANKTQAIGATSGSTAQALLRPLLRSGRPQRHRQLLRLAGHRRRRRIQLGDRATAG